MTVNTTFLPKTNGLVFSDRLQARADKGRVFLMADNTPAPDPLTVVSDPVLTGDPYVGSTVTVSNPVVTGGLEPYGYDYMWLDTQRQERSDINNTTLLEFDKGKNVSCYVTVVSADGQTVYATSNSIGPVTYAPTNANIKTALFPSYDIEPFVRHTLRVKATAVHSLSYDWEFLDSEGNWLEASQENVAAAFPDVEAVIWEVNRNGEPRESSFMMNFITGPGPAQFRCRVVDTDPDGNTDQKFTTTSLNYV